MWRERLAVYWEFARPFTLAAPAVGMATAGLAAWAAPVGGAARWANAAGVGPGATASRLAAGAMMAAALNAFSNGLNQICDVELDRINKAHRPLCTGALDRSEAQALTTVWLIVALLLASLAGKTCFWLAVAAALLTAAYSLEPIRLKCKGLWANVAIALPRGLLLTLCGWSVVKGLRAPDPWVIGGVNFLFLLGAATTKDYGDMAGDAVYGCRTLPITHGIERSARLIAPSFVVPFLALALAARLDWLAGQRTMLTVLGLGLAVWGAWTAWTMARAIRPLSGGENPPAWKHMYLMMLTLQVGVALAYVIG